jgi:hypothetical protein
MISSRMPLRTALALGVVAACFVLLLAERTGLLPVLHPFATALYEWAVVIGGFAILLGVGSVAWLHVRRIQGGQAGWWQSLALLAVMLAVFLAGIVNPAGDRSPLVEWAFDSVLAPGAAALLALTVFFLGATLYHLVRVGRRGGAWVLAGLLFMLVAQTPAARALLPPEYTAPNGVAAGWIAWVIETPVTATLRGALLGVALALVVVVVRFVAGAWGGPRPGGQP